MDLFFQFCGMLKPGIKFMQLGLTLGFPHAPVASELEGSGALMLKACVLCFQTQQSMLSNDYKVISLLILKNSLVFNFHRFKEILGLSADLSCSLLNVLLQISAFGMLQFRRETKVASVSGHCFA